MSKIEIDLKALGNLQQEIKILESRKSGIEREAEKIVKDAIKEKREADKEITKCKEDFDIYKRNVEKNHKKIEEELTNRTKDLIMKEKEGRDLDKDMQAFNAKKRAFSAETKEIGILRSNYLDREHKANLLIVQYKKAIGELPPDKPKVEKVAPKATKKKKK